MQVKPMTITKVIVMAGEQETLFQAYLDHNGCSTYVDDGPFTTSQIMKWLDALRRSQGGQSLCFAAGSKIYIYRCKGSYKQLVHKYRFSHNQCVEIPDFHTAGKISDNQNAWYREYAEPLVKQTEQANEYSLI